jgi:hypothetical protein
LPIDDAMRKILSLKVSQEDELKTLRESYRPYYWWEFVRRRDTRGQDAESPETPRRHLRLRSLLTPEQPNLVVIITFTQLLSTTIRCLGIPTTQVTISRVSNIHAAQKLKETSAAYGKHIVNNRFSIVYELAIKTLIHKTRHCRPRQASAGGIIATKMQVQSPVLVLG